ncbi:MAG: phosphoribosylformylglycinamidine synthase, partial [Opitutus sp.]|nr:phosphoribosylformylglycinamidine synthase [Opitutus sp.]
VGKDSMSMSTVWKDGGAQKRMTAPVSLVVSAFAAVEDVRLTLTPQLRSSSERWSPLSPAATGVGGDTDAHPEPIGDTVLLLLDLGRGRNRLGGSILAQVYCQTGATPPDVDRVADLKNFWAAIQQLGREQKILAYHDRSDGGLLATVVEMAFAGQTGVELDLTELASRNMSGAAADAKAAALPEAAICGMLFSEELGAVIQVRGADLPAVRATLAAHQLDSCASRLGSLAGNHSCRITAFSRELFSADLFTLRALWSDVTYRIQSLRDNPACAEMEHQLRQERDNPGITPKLTFEVGRVAAGAPSLEAVSSRRLAGDGSPYLQTSGARPKIAILREQGVNSHVEMAAAFTRAGFAAVDVHMTDILDGRVSLDGFRGLAACGGFSYGDVLGAGEGWAKSILFHERARAEFAAFFAREDAFALGVCNGCQ